MRSWIDKISHHIGKAWPGADTPSAAAPALPGAAAALVALALERVWKGRDVIVLAPGPDEVETFFSDLRAFLPAAEPEPLLLFPPEPADKGDVEREGMRLAVARELFAAGRTGGRLGRLLVTTGTALLAPLPDPDAVAAAGRMLKAGGEVDSFDSLAPAFSGAGYSREAEVVAKGQMAIRGGLIDIWPPTSPLPVRVDFFGDSIETIREFDPATQRSGERLSQIWIPPCKVEAIPSASPVAKLPEGAVLLWLEHDRIAGMTRRPEDEAPTLEAFDGLVAAVRGRAPFRQLFTGDPPPQGVPTIALDVVPPPGLADIDDALAGPDLLADARRRLFAELEDKAGEGMQVEVLLDTAGGVEWLSRELPEGSRLHVRQGVLSGGCEWPSLGFAVLGQPDVYATRKRSSRRLVPPAIASRGGRIDRIEELRPGDLVVHIDHGIGRYAGNVEIEVDGRRQEVMTVLFAEGAKLHVPVSHAHLLSRYVGVGGRDVQLSRLGGRKWKADCIKAQRAIVDYAAALLEVQAERNARPGFAHNLSSPWIEAFEAAFPYTETPDQLTCIEAVKKDMAATRPMDRLICGDAGYGKTEIAMRAAFIAVMNGKQVAVLAPTTVLAEQHFATFRDRMASFPVRIEVLSRLRSPAQRAQVLADVAKGGVDILIGTHALVQPTLSFHDLGLVIIDEEQRFGVVQKEMLKRARAMVDVLTLSATPIPRTLYMSMTGARDMSLLQTPPQARQAIETRVERDRDEVIRAAVLREVNREGQVFFIHNRVVTMDVMLERLHRLLPEVRIAVAHGQMPAGRLGETMRRFEAGEFDLLLCTTIIESGLDIPRANTMIVHRADRFGLAELYQIRGRVGRSSRRGYAYLLIPPMGVMDNDARLRIQALQRHGGLGGGLNLALRDLEIRGAGNILGAEQSGHIAAVGFQLYCQLLRRTVARLKGEKPPMLVDVDLQLDFLVFAQAAPPLAGAAEEGETTPAVASACLPYSYIDDESLRMGFHRRIASATTIEEVRALRGEIAERFGKMPVEAMRMLRLAELRVLGAMAGLTMIGVKEGIVKLLQRNGQPWTEKSGRLPRIRGGNPDAQLTSLFRLVTSLPGGRLGQGGP